MDLKDERVGRAEQSLEGSSVGDAFGETYFVNPDLVANASVRFAVSGLGNGTQVSAQDTVPFASWCAGERLDSYEEAWWLTVSGSGDRDTNCAIVGGIVATYTGVEGVPEGWRKSRGPLPSRPFGETVSA